MKTLLTTILALVSSLAIAQRNSLSSAINDDGKTLSIRINGTLDGKAVDYSHTFNVAGLRKDERDALRQRVLDSLNISQPEPPPAPQPPATPPAPQPPAAPPAPQFHGESVTISRGDGTAVWVNSDDSQVMAVGGKHPYTKEVKYNSESGKLHVRYRFERDGEAITYERTVDVHGKSQQERQRIIDGIEKEIGVPQTSR